MSFKANNLQQITLTDSFNSQSQRTQKIVLKSWAKDFSDIVFPAINEERFAVLYSDHRFSRPNTPVNVMIGALMLKEMNGLNEDELLQAICCDVRYQYALHTTSFEEQPVSDRTFSRFRERLYNYELETGVDLLREEMESLAQEYAKYMNLNKNVKRMDSLMIASHCKRMSRLEILYTVCANAVRLIHRLGADELLAQDFNRYLDPDDLNEVIYYCKGEDAASRLERELANALRLKGIMASDEWHGYQEYQLLIRVINEQSQTDENGNVSLRDKGKITSDSLQNPSDPDATYRRKAGKDHKGYVGNIIETTGEDGAGLITGVSYEENVHADTAFTREYLESRSGEDPDEIMIVDGAYSSVEIQKEASDKNVRLVPTALAGKDPDPVMSDFQISEDGKSVESCPCGHAPTKCTYYEKTGVCRCTFSRECCENCPNREHCQAKEQRRGYAVHISLKAVAQAGQMKEMCTEEYKALSRKRNGVEGVMSVLRRKYHVDEIPVCGKLRSRAFFMMKIGAYNIARMIKHRKDHLGDECALLSGIA